MAARQLVPVGSSEGGRSKRPAFGSFTNEPIVDEQMDALTTLGVLIAVFTVSAIVVWIYTTRT